MEDTEIQSGKVQILNNLGQLIREEEIVFKDKNASIKTDDLANGVYHLTLRQAQGDNVVSVSKRFVISR